MKSVDKSCVNYHSSASCLSNTLL